MEKHTEKAPLQCGMCFKRLTRIDNLRVHEAIHLRNFTCAICLQVFQKALDLNIPLKAHEKSYKSSKCPKKFSELDHLERHEASHRKRCTECSEHFTSQMDLRRHMKIHNDTFKCKYCSKAFGELNNLKQHEVSHLKFVLNVREFLLTKGKKNEELYVRVLKSQV
ncbi:zinc finger protein OZF-like [Stegodyphus dumicola]|uniref:zinc finger protein OZF-like n=1 Tax=Stegodyphus dumicola TaxID=202533 RepID=UPI0015AE7CBD|nr:zinc finger protein OZF-like [Stegodyphus dumicola]